MNKRGLQPSGGGRDGEVINELIRIEAAGARPKAEPAPAARAETRIRILAASAGSWQRTARRHVMDRIPANNSSSLRLSHQPVEVGNSWIFRLN